jgi:hypothetical protein
VGGHRQQAGGEEQDQQVSHRASAVVALGRAAGVPIFAAAVAADHWR